MTAEGLLTPIVIHAVNFIGWFAVILLGFSILRMIGGQR